MRRITFILALCLLMAQAMPAHAREVKAKAVMLMDMTTGIVHYEQDPDKRIAPASLTKIMTMYLLFEAVEKGKVKLTDKVTVSKAAASTGGSSMHLKKGEKVTLGELAKGMAIASGNDACVAVAEYLGGSRAKFVKRMNAKAKALGMTNTTFKNPHGLPADGQLTTARDMLILARAYLTRFPGNLKTYHSVKSFTHNGIKRKNCNRLLGNCPGVDGLKTGYVKASGYNLIATAKRGGRRIITVVLGATNPATRASESRFILEAGFKATPRTRYVATAADLPGNKKGPGFKSVTIPERPGRKNKKALALVTGKAIIAENKAAKAERPPVPGEKHLSFVDETPSRADSGATETKEKVVAQFKRPETPEPKTEPSRVVSKQALIKGGYTLQESSWADEQKALARVKGLQAKGFQARVAKADLGDRGVWHRVVIGSFADMEEAKAFKKSHDLRYTLILKQDT